MKLDDLAAEHNLQNRKVRSRFAPSPTGFIHCGNARTALFNLLFAMQHKGAMLLRIENTDKTRSQEVYVEGLLDDLNWLGINWQGDFIYQTQSYATHEEKFAILRSKKLVYPCFCSDKQLLLNRKMQLSRGLPPRYLRTCLQLSEDEINTKIKAGDTFTWRFYVESGEKIIFTDLVKGKQIFSRDTIGDFIIKRADGSFPFLFANSVDDACMHVSHVFRGEDHLTNTPRQLLILDALGLERPKYGHLPLILADSGSPLSKREKGFGIKNLREQGYLPVAILNYLARVGCSYKTNKLLTLVELANLFKASKLSKSPAKFDINQLRFWQKNAILAMSPAEFSNWINLTFPKNIDANIQKLFLEIMQQNINFPHEANYWLNIISNEEFKITDDLQVLFKEMGELFFKNLLEHITTTDDFLSVCKSIGKKYNFSGKKLYMPIRLLLTGKNDGPELAQIAKLLGVSGIKKRIQNVIGLF